MAEDIEGYSDASKLLELGQLDVDIVRRLVEKYGKYYRGIWGRLREEQESAVLYRGVYTDVPYPTDDQTDHREQMIVVWPVHQGQVAIEFLSEQPAKGFLGRKIAPNPKKFKLYKITIMFTPKGDDLHKVTTRDELRNWWIENMPVLTEFKRPPGKDNYQYVTSYNTLTGGEEWWQLDYGVPPRTGTQPVKLVHGIAGALPQVSHGFAGTPNWQQITTNLQTGEVLVTTYRDSLLDVGPLARSERPLTREVRYKLEDKLLKSPQQQAIPYVDFVQERLSGLPRRLG